MAALRARERTGKQFGDPGNPLLVSCRSGAKFSMPGMMDTVLNIGLNDEVAGGMVRLTGDERFVYDSYRRLIQMFGTVVMGSPTSPSRRSLTKAERAPGSTSDADLTADDWKAVTARVQGIVQRQTGTEVPAGSPRQLRLAPRRSSDPGTERAPSTTATPPTSPTIWHGGEHPDDGLRQPGRGFAPPGSP